MHKMTMWIKGRGWFNKIMKQVHRKQPDMNVWDCGLVRAVCSSIYDQLPAAVIVPMRDSSWCPRPLHIQEGGPADHNLRPAGHHLINKELHNSLGFLILWAGAGRSGGLVITLELV